MTVRVVRDMRISRNQRMLVLLGGDAAFTEPSSYPIPDALRRLLDGGFEHKSGLTFLRSLVVARASALESLTKSEDETGIETFVNEIHIEDFVEVELPFVEVARLACDFAFMLTTRLQNLKPQTRFRVIVSAMAVSPSGSVRDTCVVRFHEQRDGQQWLSEDLDQYREEAIEMFELTANVAARQPQILRRYAPQDDNVLGWGFPTQRQALVRYPWTRLKVVPPTSRRIHAVEAHR